MLLGEMIKPEAEGKILYWSILFPTDQIVVRYGYAGEKPRVLGVPVPAESSIESEVARRCSEAIEKGFRLIEEHDYHSVVCSYDVTDVTTESISARHTLEDRIDEALFATCNGYCDGGSVSGFEMSITCFVLVRDAALGLIQEIAKDSAEVVGRDSRLS
jgi:hypothetical protein